MAVVGAGIGAFIGVFIYVVIIGQLVSIGYPNVDLSISTIIEFSINLLIQGDLLAWFIFVTVIFGSIAFGWLFIPV